MGSELQSASGGCSNYGAVIPQHRYYPELRNIGRRRVSQFQQLYQTPTPRIHSEYLYDIRCSEDFPKNLVRLKNYGFLAVNAIHRICLFLSPEDFHKLFQSCKLMYSVLNTNLFWEQYYSSYFLKKSEEKRKKKRRRRKNKKRSRSLAHERKEEAKEMKKKKEEEEIIFFKNWKKQFYLDFYLLKDCHFTRNFLRKNLDISDVMKPANISICGQPGCGKQDFVKCIYECFGGGRPFFLEKIFSLKFDDDSLFSEKQSLSLDSSSSDEDFDVSSRNDGSFICFSVNDRSSFESVKDIVTSEGDFNKDGKHGFLLLLGIVDEEKEESGKKREVEIDEAIKIVKEGIDSQICGYVEWKVGDVVDVVLPLGIILDRIFTLDRAIEELGRKII